MVLGANPHAAISSNAWCRWHPGDHNNSRLSRAAIEAIGNAFNSANDMQLYQASTLRPLPLAE
jgi:hypothetical protein